MSHAPATKHPSTALLNPIGLSAGSHHHSHHQLLLGVQGQTACALGSVENVVNQSRCCIVPANQAHDYEGMDQKNDMLVVNIEPQGQLATLLNSASKDRLVDKMFERPQFLTIDNSAVALIQYCAKELSRTGLNPFTQTSLVTGLLSEVNRLFDSATSAKPTIQQQHKRIPVNVLNQLIDSHLRSPLSVGELAHYFFISESYFYALFQQRFGLTPHQYTQQRRLLRAKTLLSTVAMNISDIAFELGFSSPSDFSRVFKKQFGCTPRQVQQGSCSH